MKLGAILPGQVVKKMVSIMNNSQAQLTFNLSVMFSAELQETKVGDQGPSGVFMPPHLTLLRQLRCARPFQVLSLSDHLHKKRYRGVPVTLLLHIGKPQLGEPLPLEGDSDTQKCP